MGSEQASSAVEGLLGRIMRGDDHAIDELLSSYRVYLRRLIDLRMNDQVRGRLDPSDVVQETQIELSRRMSDYLRRRPTSLKLWLRRTAIENLARMERHHLTAKKRAVARECPLPDRSSMFLARHLTSRHPSEGMRNRERAAQMRKAIDTLRGVDQEILLLRHVEELSNAEVAELLRIEPAAASKRYGRALRRLRERLVDLSRT